MGILSAIAMVRDQRVCRALKPFFALCPRADCALTSLPKPGLIILRDHEKIVGILRKWRHEAAKDEVCARTLARFLCFPVVGHARLGRANAPTSWPPVPALTERCAARMAAAQCVRRASRSAASSLAQGLNVERLTPGPTYWPSSAPRPWEY
jgi:hypothetical protein